MESKIRQIRKDKNLTHEQIANAVGISRPYYTLIENGYRHPSLEVAIKLAKILECQVEDLFFDN